MDFSFEGIRDRIKEHLENPASKIEGSFSMDNIGAVSQELARIVAMEVLPIPDNVLLDTAEGIMLDRKALDFNEVRNSAQKAVGQVSFAGTEGAKIPLGTIILAESLEFITTAQAVIGADGTATVDAECLQEGQIGNVSSGKITALKLSLNGITNVINSETFTGGVDVETDTAFRERVLEKIQKPITSGNKNHYIYWAKQVSGVGKAKVLSCHNGNGTVKVIVLSDLLDVPDDTIIANVVENIESNRPVGADVTVSKAVPLPVTVNVSVTLANGYDTNTVKAAITSALQKYLNTISFDETKNLSYYKIGDIIFGVDGVSDIVSYTLNGGSVSLQTAFEEFFKLQEVVLSVGQ